ncbi:MAG: hypothetical protein KF760_09360 [Candidatus Eremiobacteraeota bacterium]|nr:hypothetical protein [Candidatus Eremiobacteraeota bacterium]MCW5866031.1 hypothetical protein [Candidatus Eremiobacteraeota bacterium]
MDSQLLDNFAKDRERLLLALRRKGVRGGVPAQVVREAILHCQWRIQRVENLHPSLLGLCCPEERVLKLPVDFRQRLRVPETAAAVMNETLAHELGHVRLHLAQMLEQTIKRRIWEKEAGVYARVFLVPIVNLVTRFPMAKLLQAETQQQRWRQVSRLAEEFRVTGWFLASALEMYGLAQVDSRRRLIQVLPLAHELARRFAFGRMA